ncbi:hypothetical protein D3C80_1845050 [compost metagenome]
MAAEGFIFNLYRHRVCGSSAGLCQLRSRVWQIEFAPKNRADFISRTDHAETVGTVRCQVKFQDLIVQAEHLQNILADLSILRQYENALLQLFRQQLVVQAQLFSRADHAL